MGRGSRYRAEILATTRADSERHGGETGTSARVRLPSRPGGLPARGGPLVRGVSTPGSPPARHQRPAQVQALPFQQYAGAAAVRSRTRWDGISADGTLGPFVGTASSEGGYASRAFETVWPARETLPLNCLDPRLARLGI